MAFKRSGVRFPSPPLGWRRAVACIKRLPISMVILRRGGGLSGGRDGEGLCGNSSVGRAQPCQGWGRGFESRFPLWNTRAEQQGSATASAGELGG